MKHTPGPWEIEPPTMAGTHRLTVGSYGFGSVCAISRNGAPRHQSNLSAESPYYQKQQVTEDANANLIAAAPELYDALKVAIKRLDDGSAWSDEHLYKLEAIIAKAEGRT